MYAGRGSTNSKAAGHAKTDGFAFSQRSAGMGNEPHWGCRTGAPVAVNVRSDQTKSHSAYRPSSIWLFRGDLLGLEWGWGLETMLACRLAKQRQLHSRLAECSHRHV